MKNMSFKEYMISLGFKTLKETRERVFPCVPIPTVTKWWDGTRKPSEVANQAIQWYLKCVELDERLKMIEDMAGRQGERDTNNDTTE